MINSSYASGLCGAEFVPHILSALQRGEAGC